MSEEREPYMGTYVENIFGGLGPNCEMPLLATIIRNPLARLRDVKSGTVFYTNPEAPQQVGIVKRLAGARIEAHSHSTQPRTVILTSETLVVLRGRVEVSFWDLDDCWVVTHTLEPGDILTTFRGGHGYEFLEDAEIVEVKQGPVQPDDKRWVNVREGAQARGVAP